MSTGIDCDALGVLRIFPVSKRGPRKTESESWFVVFHAAIDVDVSQVLCRIVRIIIYKTYPAFLYRKFASIYIKAFLIT